MTGIFCPDCGSYISTRFAYHDCKAKLPVADHEFDRLARLRGFTNAAEYTYLLALVDQSTMETYAKFASWITGDGTKAGLIALLGSRYKE